MARFQEITLDVEKSYLSTAWKTFGTEFTAYQITAIQFQTAANAPFYLYYRTYNKGRGWLPYVSSRDDDYAGFGLNDTRGVQAVGIQVKENSTDEKMDDTYIVMYRARVGNRSLPWVSNARPDLMSQVYEYFHLDGELDTSSGNAGIPDADDVLKEFEIRIFKDNGLDNSDSSIGGEADASLSYLVDGSWNTFDKSVMSSHMDGIKIQTSSNKNYYLLYKTWNEGKDGYYPAVKSTENDYAGSSGKPIQRLNIQVYQNDGTKLASGVVVMYRAYVDGKWLPWVSNADPEWMRAAQTKYSLGGTLDTGSSYAGIGGKNIGGVEIRIFEDDSPNPGSGSFTGGEVELSMRYMANSSSNWTAFSKSVLASPIDGIEIRTSGKDYYLSYKTWNEGKDGYYPAVKSTENDYAGSPGKPIQRLSIQVYRNDGTKLTSGVVVMYRAYVDGRWLPWVSNADPEWMSSVQAQYNLGGTLDTGSSYAGISGKNIAGIEIRAFEGNTTSLPVEDLPGEEASASLSYLSNGSWKSFSKSVMASPIDGIKIQTSTGKPYYLLYKTQNEGKSGFYPAVKSTENDYAGSSGKAIQKLSIYAYQNDGTKLTTGVVVMYRAYVDGRWLPWVSNADPEWMRAAQSKYNLDGTLDTGSYYAGIGGKNIAGVEIRVFEENTSAMTPTGKHKIINAPFISQNGLYPTGCESVTATMALQYAGVSITVDDFIDQYLDRSGFPFDPNLTFGGNPRSTSGYGCYAPVIKKALDKILANKKYEAEVLYQVPLETLCAQYIDHDIPVILWATMGMRPSRTKTWDFDGRRITWVQPEHCLLLVGYDDNHYIFNDPQSSQPLTYYSKTSVEAAYKAQSCQTVVIRRGSTPSKPEIDIAELARIDRKAMVNTYYYSSYYNSTYTDLGDIDIPSDLNDFNILTCFQLLFAYFWDQKDHEKTDALYAEMLNLRKLNPSYKTIWSKFLNDQEEFELGYKYYAPGRKTMKIKFRGATYFSVDKIQEMHQSDDWLALMGSFIPGVGAFLSSLLSTMKTLEQNGEVGFSDAIVSAFSDARGPVLEELMDIFKGPSYIATAMDTFVNFTSTVYGTATEDRTTYVKDGVTLQDGDSFLNPTLYYDMGVETHDFRFYFRNGYPLVTNLEDFVFRSDGKAMGQSLTKYKEFESEGYVPSEKHLERGYYWPGEK